MSAVEYGLSPIPAAPTQVSSSGAKQPCPDCGREVGVLYGLMYDDRTLRCGDCHDDVFYADTPPEVRAEAERKRNEILVWLFEEPV